MRFGKKTHKTNKFIKLILSYMGEVCLPFLNPGKNLVCTI